MSTATSRRPSAPRWVVPLLIVALYVATISVPRILGSGGAVRFKLMIEAALFCLALTGLGVVVLRRGWLRLDYTYSSITALFVVFLLLSTIGLAVGFRRGYPMTDVLGDYYKFTIPVLTVFGLYAVTQSSVQLEWALAIISRFYYLLLAGILLLYVTGVIGLNQRPGLIYQFPVVLVLSYWLYRNGDPVARYAFPLVIASTLPLVYYSQSLSLLLRTVLTAVLAVFYYHTNDVEDVIKKGLVFGTIGAIGLVLFTVLATRLSADQWLQYGYLGRKMAALVGDYTFYERLIRLGGSRAAESVGVLREIDDTVVEMLFGSGMGATFVVTSPFPNSVWAGEDHFVHAGLWEAVLRTGILGGIAYLGILGAFLFAGLKVRNDSYLGALVAADATVFLALTPLTGKFLGTQFFSYALFAYALVRWEENRTT